jgi:hypothetical protein
VKIEIDQSIKIENTNKTTYVAFSNSINHVVSVSSREKKKIQTFFRKSGKRRLFVIFTFTAIVFLLIRDYLKEGMTVIIDKEYLGYEKLIAQKLKEFIDENTRRKNYRILFSLIGKKSRAHIVAYDAFRGREKVKTKSISSEDIIKIISKNMKKSGIA